MKSPETRASIHKQGLTGNESRCVAGEKRSRGSDLTGMSDPLHRHFCEIGPLASTALGIVRAKQLYFVRAWRDGIRGDAVGASSIAMVRVRLSSAAFAAA